MRKMCIVIAYSLLSFSLQAISVHSKVTNDWTLYMYMLKVCLFPQGPVTLNVFVKKFFLVYMYREKKHVSHYIVIQGAS